MAPTSQATLKRFWRGEAIQQEAFAGICEAVGIADWQAIADFSSPASKAARSPFVFDESTWVERSELTQTLVPLLHRCRVVALTGMTGIGKTALAERLVAEIEDDKRHCRLNLDEGGIAAEFSSSGAALLRSLGEEPTLADQQDPQNLLTHLLQLLRSQPHRVQIDSMERLLEGDDRQGWSEFCDRLWLDLLQQLLGGNDCQSQLILTTQELPGELESVGSRYPQRWCCEPIRGLSEAEQRELFAKRGVAENDTDYLKRIGKLYEGHPLVLRVIAEDIKACGGNVQRYWQQGKFAEQEANRPAQLSRRKLQLEVKQRVKAALERLPANSLQLLCRSAVYRRPVPPSFWLAMLPSHSEAALDLLKARGLAEEEWEEGAWLGVDGEIPLRQHNLIRSVAYERLKADEAVWQAAERSAAQQWLNHYEAVPEAVNLEQVRGYLEAFDHYLDIKDYSTVREIPDRLLETKNEVYWQLQVWGYYRELIPLHNKRLFIARELGDRQGEGRALGYLGNAYCILDNCSEAIEFHQQYLAIACEIGDRLGEGNSLYSLGNAYKNLGNYSEAIEYHQQYLAIAREIGNRGGEGIALVNWGHTLIKLEQYSEALIRLQVSLEIFRENGDRLHESYALLRLAELHQKTGSIELAWQECDRALAIATELGIPLVKECETLKQQLEEESNGSDC